MFRAAPQMSEKNLKQTPGPKLQTKRQKYLGIPMPKGRKPIPAAVAPSNQRRVSVSTPGQPQRRGSIAYPPASPGQPQRRGSVAFSPETPWQPQRRASVAFSPETQGRYIKQRPATTPYENTGPLPAASSTPGPMDNNRASYSNQPPRPDPDAPAAPTATPASQEQYGKHPHAQVHHINFHPHARAHDHTGHRRWPQFICAFFAALCSMTNGSVLGWSAPSVPALKGEARAAREDPVVGDAIVTATEGMWIAAIVPLAGIAGSMPSGVLADTIGRKYLLVGTGVGFFIGWMLIMAGTLRLGVWLLFLGRAIHGVCCGICTAVLPLYLEEIAEPAVRGFLGVLFDISTNLGLVLVYGMGIGVDQPTMAGVSSIVPALFVLTFSWMPESPLYLVMTGQDAKASKSLMWLRAGRDPAKEIQAIKRVLRASGRLKAAPPDEEPEEEPPTERKSSSLRERAKRNMNRCKKWLRWDDMNRMGWRSVVARNLFVVFGMMVVRPATGINAITFHTVLIFDRARTNVLKPRVAAVIVAIIMLPCGFVSSRLVDRLGRRALLLISLTGVAICHAVMATYSAKMDSGAPQWIPVLSMFFIIVFIALGSGPLPWLIMSELTPLRHRVWAVGTAISIQWVGAFAVTSSFEMALDMGPEYCYTIYVALAVASWLFVFFCLPETKGRTRAELQGDAK